MMIRLLFMICVIIGLMMPCAWAQEKVDVPFEIPAEFQEAWNHVQNGTDARDTFSIPDRDKFYPYHEEPVTTYLKNMSSLAKLSIESEDWVENSTYYVRYTLTNPTNELIEGDVEYLTVSYVLFLGKESPVTRTQYSDVIPKISLPPHSSDSFVAAFAINEPFDYIHFNDSIFHFTDSAILTHDLLRDNTPPDVLITPIILPSGEAYLAMKNHHFFKTMTDIRNIDLSATYLQYASDGSFKPVKLDYSDAAILPIRLKPQETAFFRLPHSFPQQTSEFKLTDTNLTITIEGISHEFISELPYKDFRHGYLADHYTKPSTRYYTPSVYDKHGMNFYEAHGTFETDDTTLYGYLRIKNPYNKRMLLSHIHGVFGFFYCRPDNTQDGFAFSAEYPMNFIIDPKKEAFLSFSVPLSQDVAAFSRLENVFMFSGTRHLHNGIVFTHKNLSPLEKAQYDRPMIVDDY